MQNLFNPKSDDKKEIEINHVIFREHDKVLQLANNPDCNVFNGDIGIINEINNNSKEISIDYYNSLIKFSSNDFNSFTFIVKLSLEFF